MPTPTTVLLIEDDEDNRNIYTMVLEHDGYRVVQAATGERGIAAALEEPPDVILLDISLPGIDGYEVARRLKSELSTRDIPLVAVTAHAFAEDQLRARRAGFDHYLPKPIEPSRMLAEVRRLRSPAEPRMS